MLINNNRNSFKGISALAKPLSTFYNPNAILPTLIIESGVTAGRTAVAAQRGGKMEATERLIEQGTSAVIWIWGVQALKKMGDFIGEKAMGLNLNFDVGSDYLRNPMKNNNINKFAKNFKVANILISTAIATGFIGFVLPIINHKISEKYSKHAKNRQQRSLQTISMEEFLNQNKKQLSKNIAFSSAANLTLSLAHTLENNQTARLLITDSGVVAGRYAHSRNKYEKIESLFRDISSIYFYLFSTKHFVNLMNKITKNTDIAPTPLECLRQEMLKHTNDKGDFLTNAFSKASKENMAKLNSLFTGNSKTIKVEDFIKHFPDFAQKAESMAKLQPIFNGNGVLSFKQATDVLSDGWLTSPEFLNNVFSKTTKGASNDKFRFISATKLEKIREMLGKFINQIDNVAKKKNINIDENLINQVTKNNIRKNFAFYAIGTGISIFALSYLIPKIQYFITKQLTNEDKFPGDCQYSSN